MDKTEQLFKEINHLHAENIGNAQRTAENAVVIGVKFHQLKEILPHGQFETAAQKQCKVSDQTRTRYMNLATERLVEQRSLKLLGDGKSKDGKSSTVELLEGKSLTVRLLDDPEQQAIPVEVRDKARAEIDADDFRWGALDIKPKELARGLEGKEIGDLYRLYNIIRPTKPKQHVAPRELTPEEKIAAEDAQAEALVKALLEASAILQVDLSGKDSKCVTRVAPARWKEVSRALVQLNKTIKPLTKRKEANRKKELELDAATAAAHELRPDVPAAVLRDGLKKRKGKPDPAEPTHSAYVNRWGRLVVEPYSFEKEIEALKSPSVFAVIRAISAPNYESALTEAARRYRERECDITLAAKDQKLPVELKTT